MNHWIIGSLDHRVKGLFVRCSIAVVLIATATGCGTAPRTTLERLSDARQLASDLLVQFTKAGDASNRAVMADTDEASLTFAREAEQAINDVQRDADVLGPLLSDLGYSHEKGLLEEFGTRFAEYHTLERNILELAVENTNLKAQRLSFGSAQEAADAFRVALEGVMPATPARAEDTWRVKALAAMAVAAVREVQVLQAPHIAEAEDAAMTRVEGRMAAAEATARNALKQLSSLVRRESRPQLETATTALEQFASLNKEITTLSRRNTNVHSLALSLGRKRTLTAACEDSLRALQEELGKRGFAGTR